MEGRWLETQAQTPSPNAGKAPLGTSNHGPRTLLATCVTHTASQSTVSLENSTDGSGRGRGVPRQGRVRESGASGKEGQAGVFQERRAPSGAPLPESLLPAQARESQESQGAAKGRDQGKQTGASAWA